VKLNRMRWDSPVLCRFRLLVDVTTEGEPIHGPAGMAVADERAVAVDLAAFSPLLLATARAIVMNDVEAEDLVQTTLEIALRHRDQLRNPDALSSWLLTIETREAFRLVRRLRRLVRLDPDVAELASAGGDRTDAIVIRHALAGLPRRTRAAVVLHHMVGLSVFETGQALGVSENTVKSQLKTGLERLRRELGDD
jgi:RNA polymerase sigma-70 factor (ECF subfamily)